MSKLRQKQRAKRHDTTCVDGKSERRHFAEAIAFVNANQWLLAAIEAAVPACLLWSVVDSIGKHPKATEEERAFCQQLAADLKVAAAEPFAGLAPAAAYKGMQAAWRLGVYAYDVPDCGRAYGTLFIASVFWLDALLQAEFWQMHEGSAFHRAATALLDDINTKREDPAKADTFDRMEASARKLAARMQSRLESIGLFVGALDRKAAA